jgi:5,10-methylenetetrahydromethanopterin reductase
MEVKNGGLKFGLGFDLYPHEMRIVDIVELAVSAEENGFDSVWMGQEALYRDVYQTLAIIAQHTKRIQLGPSVINPYTVHPAVAAAATSTLDEVSLGRAFHGIGAGGSSVLGMLGLPLWDRPLAHLREAVTIARLLFDGKKLDFEGETLKLVEAYLAQPPKNHRVPIYMAVRGPKTEALAGELADGINLGAPPIGFIPDAIRFVEPGLRKSARRIAPGEFELISSLNISISRRSEEAIRHLLKDPALRFNFAVQIKDCNQFLLRAADISLETQRLIADTLMKKGEKAASDLITPELAKPFAIVGNPEECLEQIKAYQKSGVTQVNIFQPYGPDMKNALRLIGNEVIPAFHE